MKAQPPINPFPSGMNQQKGGAENASVIPKFVKSSTAPNTPFITNTSREVYKKNKQEQPLPRPQSDLQQGQTLKLEVFNPPPEQNVVPTVPYQYLNPTLQHLWDPTFAYAYGPNVQLPMQKVFKINMAGPTGKHVEMKKIYENVLPGKDHRFTFTTLSERLKMYDFVRQILVSMNDGEEISLDSEGHKSLMSYIKFMELNPNYYSTITDNPYDGLPFGLLIYRACFPIRLDKITQSIICAKDSIGLNMRIYALSIAEFFPYLLRNPIYKKYDVWRELIYYEYIRENVIKTKKCPNFALMYSFFLSPGSTIDFFSLKKQALTQRDLKTNEYRLFKQFNDLKTIMNTKGQQNKIPLPGIQPSKFLSMTQKIGIQPPFQVATNFNLINTKSYLPDEKDPYLQTNCGTTMIIVTEAPHHNLYQWASKIYEREGIVEKMTSHGYHDENVWMSILFQISVALYVLQQQGIYIRDMTIEDNVYIKDLKVDGTPAGYWVYVVDGISYYVPNHGYLVVIDSNFKDIVPEVRAMNVSGREYKIYSSKDIFDEKSDEEQIKRKVFDNFHNIINMNAFTKADTKNNVIRPPPEIVNFINKISADTSSIEINKIIHKHFMNLMNNRIGTFLKKDSEVSNIRATTGKFNSGELVIETIDDETYKWSMIVSDKPNKDGTIEIVQRDTPTSDFYIKSVQKSSLKQYASSETIRQDGVLFNQENLLETYMVN